MPYVDRPTEIEAHTCSMAEARRLGLPDDYPREYLHASSVDRADYPRLLAREAVTPPTRGTGRLAVAGPTNGYTPRSSEPNLDTSNPLGFVERRRRTPSLDVSRRSNGLLQS